MSTLVIIEQTSFMLMSCSMWLEYYYLRWKIFL